MASFDAAEIRRLMWQRLQSSSDTTASRRPRIRWRTSPSSSSSKSCFIGKSVWHKSMYTVLWRAMTMNHAMSSQRDSPTTWSRCWNSTPRYFMTTNVCYCMARRLAADNSPRRIVDIGSGAGAARLPWPRPPRRRPRPRRLRRTLARVEAKPRSSCRRTNHRRPRRLGRRVPAMEASIWPGPRCPSTTGRPGPGSHDIFATLRRGG